MRRLIDSNALIKRFCELANRCYANSNWFHLDAVTDEIMDAPTVDAVEVVHGYWYEYYGITVCSHCQAMFDTNLKMLQIPSTWKMPNYCPNCGADMR